MIFGRLYRNFQVGSVVVVGCIKSGNGIDWTIFRNIVISWLITLPVSGKLFFYLFLKRQKIS